MVKEIPLKKATNLEMNSRLVAFCFALFHYPQKTFGNVTSVCTVDLLVPMTAAHVRTVQPVSTMYFPHRMTLSLIVHISITLFDILPYKYAEKSRNIPLSIPLRRNALRRRAASYQT